MEEKEYEQISLFDIELPPADEAAAIVQAEPEKPIYYAEVPPEEFIYHDKAENIPTVNDILKLLEKGLYKVDARKFLSDVFECGAIAVSNKFDRRQAAEREKRYLQIVNSYEPDLRHLMAAVFTKMYTLLSNQIRPDVGFNDYLGDLYMKSETSNSKAGQFFTPYNLSKACAAISINKAMVDEYSMNDKIIRINEPACGAGGMILAAVDILYNKHHFNYSRNLIVECSDIDSRCVHMAYLQLGLAGVPAVIYQRDTLSMKTWQRWETPAYIMQYLRFRNALGDGYEWFPERVNTGKERE